MNKEKQRMLMTKVKNNVSKNENVRFEILSRNPLNGNDFIMESELFLKVFKAHSDTKANKIVTERKDDLYECKDANFPDKLEWWNKNIYEVSFLYKMAYGDSKDVWMKALQMDMFNSYLDKYQKAFNATYPIFVKDLTQFEALFDSRMEVIKKVV